ncbi:MAG: Wzz/FepE/Etk N-terminal domain-containing protein [Candidatus Hodarchaeota archaeon]
MDESATNENEADLMDYLNVLWKRKWLILIPTLILVIAVGIISFLIPPKWEIDILIQPSKFLIRTEAGRLEEVMVTEPIQIASQINQNSYNHLIAAELNLEIKEFPELKAENIRDTKLVRVTAKEKDVEKAKLILSSLFNHLKSELDKKVEIEIKEIDSQIKSKEIEKSAIEEEINTNKNKLNIVKNREKEIENEMSDMKKRIDTLDKEQRSNLKKGNRSDSESLAMLLYSNEILQSLTHLNTLNELLSRKRIEEEDITLGIENKEEKIKQLENEIDNLNERKGRIDYAQLIKTPTASVFPVSPNIKLNISITGVLSLLFFIVLSFFVEYIEKNKPIRKQ